MLSHMDMRTPAADIESLSQVTQVMTQHLGSANQRARSQVPEGSRETSSSQRQASSLHIQDWSKGGPCHPNSSQQLVLHRRHPQRELHSRYPPHSGERAAFALLAWFQSWLLHQANSLSSKPALGVEGYFSIEPLACHVLLEASVYRYMLLIDPGLSSFCFPFQKISVSTLWSIWDQ